MARKWKQIDKFLEVLEHALDDAGLTADGPAAAGRRLRLRQGLPHLRRPRVPAPPLRRRARGHRRRAARRPGGAVQCRRRARALRGLALRARRPAQLRARGGRRDDRPARLRHRDRPCARPRPARRRPDPGRLALLPQGAAAAADEPEAAGAAVPPRHPPRPGGGDADRRAARAGARSVRLPGQGVRVRVAGAHQQEQDDPRHPASEATPARRRAGPTAEAESLKAFYGIREQCLERLLRERGAALAATRRPASLAAQRCEGAPAAG